MRAVSKVNREMGPREEMCSPESSLSMLDHVAPNYRFELL